LAWEKTESISMAGGVPDAALAMRDVARMRVRCPVERSTRCRNFCAPETRFSLQKQVREQAWGRAKKRAKRCQTVCAAFMQAF
jgi:hypothetical protein